MCILLWFTLLSLMAKDLSQWLQLYGFNSFQVIAKILMKWPILPSILRTPSHHFWMISSKCAFSCGLPSKVNYKRMHTGYKSYQWNHCDKSFATSGSLVKHQRTCTGDKTYQCNHCDQTFTTNFNLVTHQRIHTGKNHIVSATVIRLLDIEVYWQDIRKHTQEINYITAMTTTNLLPKVFEPTYKLIEKS